MEGGIFQLLLMIMKLLSWNVKGLRGVERRASVKDVCWRYKVVMMSLRKTKLSEY